MTTYRTIFAITLAASVSHVLAQRTVPPPRQIRIPAIRSLSPIVKTNPTVILLVHGATNDPAVAANPKPGTLDFSKTYWGYGLVSELIGAYIQRPEDIIVNGVPTSPTSAQLARRIKTLGGSPISASNWQTSGNNENTLNHHFYVPGNVTANPPPLTLMMTYRDASKRLIPQARAFVDQVFEKVNALYPNVKPNFIIVGHSMGGLLARFVLTPPNDPLAGESLSPTQKDRARWIRDRTLYVVTLASPHEGSPLANKFEGIRDFLQDNTAMLTTALKLVGFPNPNPIGFVTNVLGVTQALEHLRTDFWQNMNTGLLAPHKMVRSNGSLIPVYAMGGRTPGGSFFDDIDQFPTGGVKVDSSMDRDQRALGLILLDWALRNSPGNPKSWGPLHNASGFDLDKVQRGNFRTTVTGMVYTTPPDKITLTNIDRVPLFYRWNLNDQETDTDGMVAIQSALGFRLGTGTNRYFDHTQNYTVAGRSVRGSWYRYNSGPWDRTNHDSICHRMTVGQWIFDNLIGKAGPNTAAGAISVWP